MTNTLAVVFQAMNLINAAALFMRLETIAILASILFASYIIYIMINFVCQYFLNLNLFRLQSYQFLP